ncbi:MAG: hypothetical protein O3A46_13035 [Candidatus Poribacteria bacterium]|nr:hypothetical protein [Candidatus Poribacteria bacterium]
MKPLPTSPRATYDQLVACVYRIDDAMNTDDTVEQLALQTPIADAVSTDANGREEMRVWLDVCSALGLPFPEWGIDRQAEWHDRGRIAVRGSEFLETAAEYEHIAEMIREEHGESFVVVFEKSPSKPGL